MSTKDASSNVESYVIYCDESCHDLSAYHKFMSIGGLKVSRAEKPKLSRELRALMRACNLNSELKWRKVSTKTLDAYKKIIDFFFEQPTLTFRAIVVEQGKVQLAKYHDMDAELAFYKFYYVMLVKWLQLFPAGTEFLILLDYKSNRGADRYTRLKDCLGNSLTARITDLTIIDSQETPLAQLCDLLTGAIAAAYNGLRDGSAKESLANHIASRAGLTTLQTSTALTAEKFNIFRPTLR